MTEAPCLYVANDHSFLRDTFRDHPHWRSGGWAHSLARLEGARQSRSPVRVGGMKQRAVAIPLQHLPQPGGQAGSDQADDS